LHHPRRILASRFFHFDLLSNIQGTLVATAARFYEKVIPVKNDKLNPSIYSPWASTHFSSIRIHSEKAF
jgi:hypothetical protein